MGSRSSPLTRNVEFHTGPPGRGLWAENMSQLRICCPAVAGQSVEKGGHGGRWMGGSGGVTWCGKEYRCQERRQPRPPAIRPLPFLPLLPSLLPPSLPAYLSLPNTHLSLSSLVSIYNVHFSSDSTGCGCVRHPCSFSSSLYKPHSELTPRPACR